MGDARSSDELLGVLRSERNRAEVRDASGAILLLGIGGLATLWYLADWRLLIGVVLAVVGLPWVGLAALQQAESAREEVGMAAALTELLRRAGWYPVDELIARQRAALAGADARTMALVIECYANLGHRCQVVITVEPEGPARRRTVTRNDREEDEALAGSVELRRDRLAEAETRSLRAALQRIVREGSLEGSDSEAEAEAEDEGEDDAGAVTDEVTIVIDCPRYRIAVMAASSGAPLVEGDLPGYEATGDTSDVIEIAMRD